MGQNYSTTNDLIQLTISGMNNNVIINHHVKTLQVNGSNNRVNGLNPNCLINKLNISGINNEVDLNQNCSNVNRNIAGINNNLKFNGVPDNSQNNMHNNNPNMNQAFFRYDNNNNNGNYQQNFVVNNNNNINDINNIINNLNNMRINVPQNNQSQNQNVNNNNAGEEENNNNNNLSDFEKKKHDLFLEMDEYQYKHIERYDESRKETECAICLEDFKGIDIIKAFYKCQHIFHKKCLENWLKRSNCCPLCKHDLTEDINQAH